ncbi:MAG: transporter [Candidatus Loosdrechtia sp.]|uniref:transporter n=1 Tax=Candidatus Loosdrechtia sp. TaxID=3101272 RepID=UPI003A5F32E4|nr:MAG: transporter [Candidatus Jettenia sp. AMX2]
MKFTAFPIYRNGILVISAVILCLSGFIITGSGFAGQQQGSTYNLFNRAPRENLRPLGPEPHPYTTDPGWYQLEIHPLNFIYNRDSDERKRSFGVPVLLKTGLLENIDFQIGLDVLVWEKTTSRNTGERWRDSGFGNIKIASKINLRGNDGGDMAMAVKPFFTLPAARYDSGSGGVTGGILLPVAWTLNDLWTLEVTPSAAAVRNSDDNGYVAGFGNLAVINHNLLTDLACFVEIENFITTERSKKWQTIVRTGLTWDVTSNFILEQGIGFVLNNASNDVNIYLTLVRRF